MRFCSAHWGKLRLSIRDRGLDQFVSTSGSVLADRMAKGIDGDDTKARFDPLMGAHNAIVSNAMGFVGLALMVQNEDGSDRCPICFLDKDHKEKCQRLGCTDTFEEWIDKAADEQLSLAKRLNLVGAT
jgi:hypothetical protein